MGAFAIVGLVEPLSADLNISIAQSGQLLTYYAIGYAVLSPLLVAMTGQVGRRRVMALGLALFGLAALISAVAPGLGSLQLARVLAAAGAGMFTPVAAATAAALYPEAQRARVLAAVFFGLTLAQVVGVPAGSWIAYTFGWRWTFWLTVALALPCIALIWREVPRGLSFQPVGLRDLSESLSDWRTMLAVLFTASFLGAIYVLYTYIAPLFSETMGFGRDGVTLILVLFGCGAVVGNILGGILADRFGWRWTLSALAAMQAVVMPLFSLLPLPLPVIYALALAWPIFGWSFMAGQQMRLISIAGPRAPVVLALNAAAIYVGAALGSALGAWVLERYGVVWTGLAAGLCALGALAHLQLSAMLPPRARGGQAGG